MIIATNPIVGVNEVEAVESGSTFRFLNLNLNKLLK